MSLTNRIRVVWKESRQCSKTVWKRSKCSEYCRKNYLKHLKHIGKEISQEIKEMNEDLDRKMQKLVEKGLNKKKQSKQPINP